MGQPMMRVVAGQRPVHHIAAFIQHRAIGQLQHRHCALGRKRQHMRWLIAQNNLAQTQLNLSRRQRHARAHRIGASAKAIEQRLHYAPPICLSPRAAANLICFCRSRKRARSASLCVLIQCRHETPASKLFSCFSSSVSGMRQAWHIS